MTKRNRIFIGILLAYAIGVALLMWRLLGDIDPRYRESAEESLVETAHLMASLVEQQSPDGAIDPALLKPPVNVLRLCLHPGGIAPRIVNLGEWKAHLLARLKRQNEAYADPILSDLEDELRAYPGGLTRRPPVHDQGSALAHLLRLDFGGRMLSFISTITVFGTALDVTLSELAIESFFPADEPTRATLVEMAKARPAD